MTVNNSMAELLAQILKKHPSYEDQLVNDEFISENVGIGLINMYSKTDDLETRQLITEFMRQAGYKWLRKLLTRDTSMAAVTA